MAGIVDDLYDAIDVRRRARGLTWAQLVRELNGGDTGGRPIAVSTVTSMRDKRFGLEGDTVLQLFVWLGRTPESFVPGAGPGEPLPHVARDRILRWDPRALYAALDARRASRSMTWRQAADEIGVPAASLSTLNRKSRVAFPAVMRITAWIGKPAAAFTLAFPRGNKRLLLEKLPKVGAG